MRVLIIGAGVIGSFNAARLKQAGVDTVLLARGRRLDDLREHGVVLEHYRTGDGRRARLRSMNEGRIVRRSTVMTSLSCGRLRRIGTNPSSLTYTGVDGLGITSPLDTVV